MTEMSISGFKSVHVRNFSVAGSRAERQITHETWRFCRSESAGGSIRRPDACGDGERCGRRRGREASAAVQRCVVPGACIQLIRQPKTLGWLPWPPISSNSSPSALPSTHPIPIMPLSVCVSPTVVLCSSQHQTTSSQNAITPSRVMYILIYVYTYTILHISNQAARHSMSAGLYFTRVSFFFLLSSFFFFFAA